jgi:two-component system LytT family response regulator
MTELTKVLIAEDEPLAAEALADWVAQMPSLQLVATCGDGASALAQIRALQPDLVLMDIQMPVLTGLQVLQALAGDAHQPAVIFTTAYDEHALTAFELHAVDYLLKPFTHERFVEAIGHVQRDVRASLAGAVDALQTPDGAPLARVLVRDQGRIFPINVDAIEHLRSDTKYTALAVKGKSYLVRLPIVTFEQKLDPHKFVKLHRSCIVNLDFVESLTPDENSQLVARMTDGTLITANRDVSKKLREQSI